VTRVPHSTALSQLQDWFRRALFEILGGPMAEIDSHARAEVLPDGRVKVTVEAIYRPEK
jgi:hypothetical protein